MFNSVPLPPKDYILKIIPKCQRDSPQFTPDSEPRVTQTTLGMYCSPVEYGEGEIPDKIEVEKPHPKLVEKWANDSRAFWVDKPGKNDFFLHDMYKKYSVKTDSFDPNFRHKEKVFNRSYKYELECLQNARLQKLRDKCGKEQSVWEDEFDRVEKREHEEKHPPMRVLDCEARPPFWWGTSDGNMATKRSLVSEISGNDVRKGETGGQSPERWIEEPSLTATVRDDPCRRKYEMQLVGQPFRTEACNFYYSHYPPPPINFRPKKFT